LRFTGDGEYLEDTGFGHEDWNFSHDICADGNSYGYMYFRPSDIHDQFSILFATYDKGEGWGLCGYYIQASFSEAGAVFPSSVIRRRASELRELDDVASLGGKYRGKSINKIAAMLKKEAHDYHWRVRPTNIHRMQQPMRVSKSLTSRFGAYFTRPTELQKAEWDRLIASSAEFVDRARQDDYGDGGDIEFPEGKEYEVRHKKRERNPKLVAKAKAQFKSKFGRLFCEACDFDFANKYGNAGDGFIEVHHKIPVSQLKLGAKTTITGLALVCSNCHRILHRRRPWLTVQALRRLIGQAEQQAAVQ
jgi:predicted HNH restriction endonuclease